MHWIGCLATSGYEVHVIKFLDYEQKFIMLFTSFQSVLFVYFLFIFFPAFPSISFFLHVVSFFFLHYFFFNIFHLSVSDSFDFTSTSLITFCISMPSHSHMFLYRFKLYFGVSYISRWTLLACHTSTDHTPIMHCNQDGDENVDSYEPIDVRVTYPFCALHIGYKGISDWGKI